MLGQKFKIYEDWSIFLSYFLVLLLGFLLGLSITTQKELFTYLKSLVDIIVPLGLLIVALAGLYSWREAEQTKVIAKHAWKLLEGCTPEFKEAVDIWDYKVNFLVRKKHDLELKGLLTPEKIKSFKTSIVHNTFELQKKIQEMDVKIQNEHHLLLVINGVLYTKHRQLQSHLPLFRLDNLVFNQENDFEKIANTANEMMTSAIEFYEHLLLLSAAKSNN
ncbi:hypothetical protein [Pseudoalteromonas xiamenensis]